MKKIIYSTILCLFVLQTTEANNFVNYKDEKNVSANQRLVDFFKTYDVTIVRRVSLGLEINSITYNPDLDYMYSKNRELINILYSLHPSSYNPADMLDSDPTILIAGVAEMCQNQYLNPSTPSSVNKKDINSVLGCALDLLIGIVDVTVLYREYVDLIRYGATWTCVRSVVLKTAKRYLGWVVAAKFAYDFATGCL